MGKLLITGGAGFIGSRLANIVSIKGWDVTVLDNLSTGLQSNADSIQSKPIEQKEAGCHLRQQQHPNQGPMRGLRAQGMLIQCMHILG